MLLYYSQTGQLKQILDSLISELKTSGAVEIVEKTIVPENPFPFPWKTNQFMSIFPETFLEVPVQVKALNLEYEDSFDLIIFGWQPWYLSPSLPISSFLKTEEARRIFKDTPVITVSGSRNMWLSAYDRLRKTIYGLNASLVGNISLVDPNPNLISLVTIVGWLIHGKKQEFLGVFPNAGVPDKEIAALSRFSPLIRESLEKENWADLNKKMLALNSVKINPSLMMLERRGARLFKIWANMIYRAGKTSLRKRLLLIRVFTIYLPVGIVVLSPIVTLLTKTVNLVSRKKIRVLQRYYLGE